MWWSELKCPLFWGKVCAPGPQSAMWLFEVSAHIKGGVDLSPSVTKAFRAAAVQVWLQNDSLCWCSHWFLTTHFLLKYIGGVFVLLMIVEMLENSLLCQWGFGILAREQNPLMEQGIILSSGIHCLKTFISHRIILWRQGENLEICWDLILLWSLNPTANWSGNCLLCFSA